MLPHDSPFVLTKHAERRAKARGVPLRILAAICANADRRSHVGSGCRSLMVSKRELQRLAGQIPAADRERMQGVAVIVAAATATVVTVMHADGRKGGRYRRQRGGRSHRRQSGFCGFALLNPSILEH